MLKRNKTCCIEFSFVNPLSANSTKWSNTPKQCISCFFFISQVLNKIEVEFATGILLVPLFTTQFWFTRLLRTFTSEP